MMEAEYAQTIPSAAQSTLKTTGTLLQDVYPTILTSKDQGHAVGIQHPWVALHARETISADTP